MEREISKLKIVLLLVPGAWPVFLFLGVSMSRIGPTKYYSGRAYFLAYSLAFLSPLIYLAGFSMIYKEKNSYSMRLRRILMVLSMIMLSLSLYGCGFSFVGCTTGHYYLPR